MYVRVSGAKDTAGDFSLTLTSQPTDDYGNSMAAAKAMAMAASGSSSALGEIQYDNDVDFFKFTATVTGDMAVGMNNSGVSDLIGSVRAIDANGTQLATDDGTDNSVRISFHVTAGQTYYLSAGSISGTAGRYVLGLATQADPIPDPTPDPEPTPDPDPIPTPDPDAPTPGASVAASVVTSGGTTRLVIAGTDDNDVITLTYDGSSTRLLVSGLGHPDVHRHVRLRLDVRLRRQRRDHAWTTRSRARRTVYAGDGDDTVYENSQGAATLYGGAGDDLLVSVGGGNDVVYGEAGTDSFWVDTTDTLGDVSAAETAAKAVHRIASFYQPYTTNPASADYVSKEIDGQNLRDPACYASGVATTPTTPLFVDGPEYNDIRQGTLGDCYYLATLAEPVGHRPQRHPPGHHRASATAPTRCGSSAAARRCTCGSTPTCRRRYAKLHARRRDLGHGDGEGLRLLPLRPELLLLDRGRLDEHRRPGNHRALRHDALGR